MNISNIFSKTSLVLLCSIVAVGARASEEEKKIDKGSFSNWDCIYSKNAFDGDFKKLENLDVDYDKEELKNFVDCNDTVENEAKRDSVNNSFNSVIMNIDDNKKDDERSIDSDDEDLSKYRDEFDDKDKAILKELVKNPAFVDLTTEDDDEDKAILKELVKNPAFVDLTTEDDDKAIKEHKERIAKLQKKMAGWNKKTSYSSDTSSKNRKKSFRTKEKLISRSIQQTLKQEDPKPGILGNVVNYLKFW